MRTTASRWQGINESYDMRSEDITGPRTRIVLIPAARNDSARADCRASGGRSGLAVLSRQQSQHALLDAEANQQEQCPAAPGDRAGQIHQGQAARGIPAAVKS